MKFQDLLAFKKSFDLAMQIFELTKKFPKEEIYSLTDQIIEGHQEVFQQIFRKHIEKEFIQNIFSVS